jgi:hypothetical protein
MDSIAVRKQRPTFVARAVSVAGAVAAATAVWALAAAARVDLRISFGRGQPSFTVTPASVIVVSFLAALAGWALLGLLERFTSKARTVWTAAVVTVAALSLAGPLSATASPGTKACLIAMHLMVAAVLIPALRSRSRTNS